MMIFHSTRDLHVIIRTIDRVLIDTVATELEVEDQMGRFLVTAAEPALAGLVPGVLVIRRRDGSETHVDVTWGSLTAAGCQVRVVIDEGHITEMPPIAVAV